MNAKKERGGGILPWIRFGVMLVVYYSFFTSFSPFKKSVSKTPVTLFEARTKDRRVLCGPLWPRGQKASLYVFLSRHKNLCLRSESLEDQDPTRDTPGREEGCEASVTLAQAQWNFQNLTFKATPENKLTLDTSALTPPPGEFHLLPGLDREENGLLCTSTVHKAGCETRPFCNLWEFYGLHAV